MRFGKWDTLEELGRGGQAVVHLALDTQKVDIEGKILPTIQKALNELRQISSVEQHRDSGLRFLGAIEKYASRRNPEHCGALKQLHEQVRTSAKARTRLEREVAVLSGSNHGHIVKVLDSDLKAGWFVTEYFPLGSLDKHADLFRGRPFEALLALRPLVEAVASLHAAGTIHRDIAPKNVFRAEHGLVLGDFGLVYPGPEGRPSSTYENVGSRDWMPGWNMGSREDPSPAFDVFTLGKLLWAMVAGRHMLRLWYFREHEFNVEVMFPGVVGMAEINALLDQSVVEKEHECLSSAREMLEAVDATIARLRGAVTPRPSRPRERKPFAVEAHTRLLSALSNSESLRGNLQPRTRQALKDLLVMVHTTKVGNDGVLMEPVVHYAVRDQGEGGATALEILNSLLSIDPTMGGQSWARTAREGCLKLCLGSPPPAIAWGAVQLLKNNPGEEDIEALAWVIGKWPQELYRHSRPEDWLAETYRRRPEQTRAMVELFLDEGNSPEVQARAEELCAVMRSIDQAAARE